MITSVPAIAAMLLGLALIMLAAMSAAMMVLPLLHLATGALAFANYLLPGWATLVVALAQFPFVWLFWRSHADLGRTGRPVLKSAERTNR